MVRLIPLTSGICSHLLLITVVLPYIMSVVWTFAAGQECEFIFTFPTNSHQSRLPNGKAHLYLSVTSLEAGITSVNITMVSSEWNRVVEIPGLHAGVTVELPSEAEAEGSGFQNSAVLVTATQAISLLALSDREASAGSFLVRSTENLGTEYFVVSYVPIEGEWSEFTVSATEDDTHVRIQLEARLLFENTPYGREEINVSLMRWQTIQFQSSQDLTGSHIRANRPISVVAGSSASNVPIESGPPSHVVEHLPPLGALGTKYVLAPILGKETGYECVVIASCATTVSAFGEKVFLYPGGSHKWDASTDRIAVITSLQPVLVAQFTKSTTDRPQDGSQGAGGPAMMIVPPIDNLNTGPGVTFSTPALPPTAYYHISVTVRCSKTNRLRLNQSPLNPDRHYNITDIKAICIVQKQLRLNNSYSVISVNQVPSARHPFAVSVVVHGPGYPGGYAISSINRNNLNASVCKSTSSDDTSSIVEESMSSSDYMIYDVLPQPLNQEGGTNILSRGANRNITVLQIFQPANSTITDQDSRTDPSLSSSATTTPQYLTNTTKRETVTENTKPSVENNSLNSGTTEAASTHSTQRSVSTSPFVSIPTPVPTMYRHSENPTSPSTEIPLETSDPSTQLSDKTTPIHETAIYTGRSGQATNTPASTRVSTNLTHSTSSVLMTYTSESEDVTASATTLLNYSLSTWLADKLTVISTKQTTQRDDEATCATCNKPLRSLLYGGVAIAILLLLSMFICIAKITHSRRFSKKVLPKTSLWAAHPVKVSAEELSLSRLNVTALVMADKPEVEEPLTEEEKIRPVNGDSRCTSAVSVEVSAGGNTADSEENVPVFV